ncbi:methyltransferase [Notoacmeibacter ruber]|uniref:SAM-dependent methyltransferase n=1 Tax=Notoacmeibacter ruber TaxID=2670375 RepID=A0A3L7J403_9HYPH|nr:methyltransferase [Notoacmeibacter ruber]RLQ85189.1 SAM-dependent methyltransferase [Notoacmeibacter ruber]
MENNLARVGETILSFFNAQALIAAFELGIFDAIGDGGASEAEIYERCGLAEKSGRQMLIALSALGFVIRDGERYRLAPGMEACLRRDGSQYLGTLARHANKFLYPLWSRCADAVRQDSNQRAAVFNDSRDWFEILYSDPEDVADFHAFLSVLADPFVENFVKGYDFSRHKGFLDIGSGRAALPAKVIAAHPHLTAAVCDLLEAARHMRQELSAAGQLDRIAVYEGDVIAGDLPEIHEDLVHMGWMLHDYGVETQKRILSNIFAALPSGATFIASETPLLDDQAGPAFVALLSLNMLVSSDGGIESTCAEYLERFRQAGFANVRAMPLEGPRTLLIGEKP